MPSLAASRGGRPRGCREAAPRRRDAKIPTREGRGDVTGERLPGLAFVRDRLRKAGAIAALLARGRFRDAFAWIGRIVRARSDAWRVRLDLRPRPPRPWRPRFPEPP